MQMMSIQLFAGSIAAVAAGQLPSALQLALLSRPTGLSQFMHFSVNQFDVVNHTQHNCVGYGPCLPASLFNPTNLSTDQWVETAAAFGAEEICLTAHHEGGFSLWDTKYTNYSVMQSPYGKDIVAQFVASCKKFGIKPCYYFVPNANGFMVTHNYTADEFVEAQLGQLTELLTKYGSDYVSRLWWDHWDRASTTGCWDGKRPKTGPNPVLCPPGSFPNATGRFIELVRRLSPSTIMCPGPDCDAQYRHSGLPAYPTWYPCTLNTKHPEKFNTCDKHVESSNATGFDPYTYNSDLHLGGWFINGKGDDPKKFWNASRMWHVYFATAGAGQSLVTLNAPPDSTGQIPQPLADNMAAFGKALKAFLTPLTPSSEASFAASSCENTTLSELNFDAAVEINALISREDLTHGQRITSYAIDYLLAAQGSDNSSGANGWRTFESANFTDCVKPSETNLSCAVGIGVHGRSVGARVVDFVPVTAVAKVRFRCLTAMGEGGVRLAGFSAHRGAGPEGPMSVI